MKEEKKITKQPAKKTTKTAVKTTKTAPVKKAVSVPVVDEKVVKTAPVVEVSKTEQPKKTTLNQELNLLIGLFSLIVILTFCFAFQGGDSEVLGWELFLKAGEYSGVFKWLMILYVVSIFVDCILAIRVDTENELFNIIQKALYMFTVIINFIVIAVLLSIISKVGLGLIIFFIISIISAIVKFARIYAK